MTSPSSALLLRAKEELHTTLSSIWSTPAQKAQVQLDVLAVCIALRDGRFDHVGHGQQVAACRAFGLPDAQKAPATRYLAKLRKADECPHRAGLKLLNRRLAGERGRAQRIARDVRAGACGGSLD